MFNFLYFYLVNFYIKLFKYLMTKVWIDTETIRLGSDYGGWNLLNKQYLIGSTIISAGCGEDISFDIEFINQFDANVIFIDPTPRSVAHLKKVLNNLKDKTLPYSIDGNQPIESYDLKNIELDNIELIECALYIKDNEYVNFYPPKNPLHVSHSISNWQYSNESENIMEVKTITIEKIMKDFNIENLKLIKMDIEGAENQVLPYILKKNINPNQILVEFDELHLKKLIPYLKASLIIIRFLLNGYKLIKTPKFPDMLFAKIEK